ncbi:MAG: phosphohistidine phosphatase [Pseudomonadota bacterium]|nr:phosphohistidine phosphatase [Pseudomonadota bacterium]
MKTLILVRHAKSSWDNQTLDDFERPLNERGKRDAPRMAQFLKTSGMVPQHIISSPARRARKTAKILAEYLLNDASAIELVGDIYEAASADLFRIARTVEDKVECCMLVGHNPGMTDFANDLINNDNDHIENIPTTGIVILNLDLKSWQSVGEGTAVLRQFMYPDRLPDESRGG